MKVLGDKAGLARHHHYHMKDQVPQCREELIRCEYQNLQPLIHPKQHQERSVLPTRLVTRQVMFLQPQKFGLRNSSPVLFQSSLSRFYTKMNNTALSYYFIGGIAFFISVDNVYSWYVNGCNKRLLNKTIEKGTRPDVGISGDKLVPRPVIVERLKKVLQPYEDQSFYYVVCGEHGTGKTTLTRIASREVRQVKDKDNKVIQDGGMGVIYVDVPVNPNLNKLDDAFGKALNFTFEEHISYTKLLARKIFGATEETNDPKWERAMDAFKHGSEVYKTKHKKPPVIIYDNVSRLMHKNPEILDILQDDAKDNADDQKYIAVFISSEDSVPRRMESRSAWSRAKKPVIEIGDFSKEESIKYLTEKRKINKVDAKKYMNWLVDALYQEANLNGSREEIQHCTTPPKAIASRKASKVLETNIFTYHPEKNTVSFQSQLVECYIWEKSDIFIK
ncbi:hypothetical protein C1645_836302 [Glomus cerebriforme]|uniref:ATPase domain-containing protein n=1 Tax=Glomus cerebriforme TaxID=658196 RepID=A0A397S647_9GLOM|nr:hypothetical protein C1645_836302 [Glomus cerebriforme]